MQLKTVFYSWQSDLPSSTNRSVIEKAINNAIKRANIASDSPDENYCIDRDTLNECGSPDIVETIFKKINECTLFVGDITPIASTATGKAMPNPNVLFESGYCVGSKGIERSIFALNEAIAPVESLPFDLKTKRILKYKLSEKDLDDPENKQLVIKALASAIHKSLELIKELPPVDKPSAAITTQTVKRERDLIKLKRFMESMPPKVIQNHVNLGFESLIMDFNAFTALYNMQAVQGFIGFKLYDKELESKVENLVSTFDRSLSFGYNFHHHNNNIYKFSPSKVVSENDYLSVLTELKNALEELISYVHDQYIEIDIEEYNKRAWNAYWDEIEREAE